MACSHCNCQKSLPPMGEAERILLSRLAALAYLPLCRYLIRNPEEHSLSFVMAAPVYLAEETDSSEIIQENGAALLLLQKRGYITLDYGVPITGADYDLYRRSRHYQDFVWSCTMPHAEPWLEEGSVGLTLQGQDAADHLDL